MTENPRKYGDSPYNVVLVHGGPGAPGEMKSVAQELSSSHGVLEPLQTANSVNGQIAELKKVIETETDGPVYLIGYSWGAWLSFMLAAESPTLVKKLILVSSGPFEAQYVEQILHNRLNRLSAEEQERVKDILADLQSGKNSSSTHEFGSLMDKADTFERIADTNDEKIEFQAEIYQKVWPEADNLRKSGQLLKYGNRITCPVVAIHGDFDPHPAKGVEKPLSKVLKDFKFILLNNCGHTPWMEKQAKEKFYQVLKAEM